MCAQGERQSEREWESLRLGPPSAQLDVGLDPTTEVMM